MPDHIPGWTPDTLAAASDLLRKDRERRSMPAHRIAYHLVTIQVSLLVIVGMVWAEVGGYGVRWLNLIIASVALYTGFTAHHRLWRGR